jgi:hypothetical protein
MKPTYITSADLFRQCVQLGATRENKVLEFKERYASNDHGRRELRKDVVALANTFGGALVIGIVESRDEGYARAERLDDPDVKTTMAWVDQTLGAKVFPTPNYSLAIIQGLAAHDILVVNVHPYPDGLGAVEWDDEALRYPVRGEDRVRYLRAPEVVKAMTMASTRRIWIALNELIDSTQTAPIIHLASPVYLCRPETDLEFHARLRNDFGVSSWKGTEPPVPRTYVEVPWLGPPIYFERYDERHVLLAFDRRMLAVLLSVIRDVWRHASGQLGMMLDCDTLIPSDRMHGDLALRSR